MEYIGEKIYIEEILAEQQVWVARGAHKNIYAQEIENYAFSLPTWSSRDRVDAYLKGSLLFQRFEPHAIPLWEFANAWLSDKMRGISEVQVNPSAKASRVLALTNEEFQEQVEMLNV